MKHVALFAFVLALASSASALAQGDELVIEIVGQHESAIPIGVVPFHWAAAGVPENIDVAAIIDADLSRSGQFATIARQDIIERPFRLADVDFATWRLLQVDYIIIGEITGSAVQGFDIAIRLVNVTSGHSLIALVFSGKLGGLRYTAHHIADTVFEELLGVPGVFRTRLAYITAAHGEDSVAYSLMVADADGNNPQAIVRSAQPLMSPTWSPDARRLAYVSFEQGNSSIYIQEIASGARELIASFKGINGAPSFSPDGTRMALTLSRTGDPEIYVMDLASKRLVQLTRHWAIDTEPTWTPDGYHILFTSDRGGKPQLYEVLADASEPPRRITRVGEYNARANLSPDGRQIALVNGEGNNYRIGLLDRASHVMQLISDGPLDESPSFAPNGRMILYASREGGQGVLSAVPIFGTTAFGRTAHQLIFSQGDIREPAWSPLRH